MTYENGQFISAYTQNDTLFEGVVKTRKDGVQVVLNEKKQWTPIENLKYVRIIEEQDPEADVTNLVNDDVEKCDLDKMKDLDDDKLEKLGADREQELIKQGLKIKNKGDYSSKFSAAIKAKRVSDDVDAGNLSVSDALQQYQQSKEVDIEMRINKSLKENNFVNDMVSIDSNGFSGESTGSSSASSSSIPKSETPKKSNIEYASDSGTISDNVISKEVTKKASSTGEEYASAPKDNYSGTSFSEPTGNTGPTDGVTHSDSDFSSNDQDLIDSGIYSEFHESYDDAYDRVSESIEGIIDSYEENCDRYSEKEMYRYIAETLQYDDYKETLKECNDSIPDAVLKIAENIALQEFYAGKGYTGTDKDFSELYRILYSKDGVNFEVYQPNVGPLNADAAKAKMADLKSRYEQKGYKFKYQKETL